MNLKRIAVTGVISGALGLAAIGFGAGTANADDGLDAIAEAELCEDAVDVGLDRRGREVQLRADLGVGQPERDPVEHVAFPG